MHLNSDEIGCVEGLDGDPNGWLAIAFFFWKEVKDGDSFISYIFALLLRQDGLPRQLTVKKWVQMGKVWLMAIGPALLLSFQRSCI